MEALLDQLPLLLLVATRLIGLMTSSPLFSNRLIPPQVRFALSFILGLFMLPGIAPPTVPVEGAHLILACLIEMLVGIVMGFVTLLVLSVLQMVGTVIDMEMGFTLVNIFDPMTGQNNAMMGSLFQSLALVLFLGINGHHWLLRALVQSYALIPVGGPIDFGPGALYVAYLFGDLMAVAIQIVMPFVAVMLLTMVAFAGLNRAVSQMNIFAIGLGTKTFVGLLMLILLLPFYGAPMTRLFEAGYQEILHVLDLMKPSM